MHAISKLAVASLLLAGMQTQALALTEQQNRMKTCNAEAKSKALKGDERKAFMKECLSSKKEVQEDAKPVKDEGKK